MNFDSLSRRVVAAFGVVIFALGALAFVFVKPFVGVLPSTYLIVVGAGVIAFLIGLWMARQRYRGGVQHTPIPDVEYPLATPAPGTDVDRAIYRLTRLRQGTTEYRDQIQKRLGEVAVSVIRHRDDCSRPEAIRQLEEGTWTDNATAAGFFTGGSPPAQSTFERLFGDESSYEHWVQTTVDALHERAGLTMSRAAPEESESGGIRGRLGLGSGDNTPTRTGYEAQYDDDESERVSENVLYWAPIETGEWRGVAAFALVAAGWGIVTFTPTILLVSVVAIGFAAYARASSPPELSNLEVERHLSEENPQPGESVEVTVSVRNAGNSFLPDLRLVDRVPGPMTVVEGSPRLGTALGSDAKAQFTYTVIAERGVHEWPLLAIGRDVSGSTERKAAIEVDAELRCVPSLRTVNTMPVRSQTSLYSGQVDTSIGGSGLEFFSVREYREGDPLNRIDWKRHARTGELATIDFRQERAAQVVLLFDARESAYVSPTPHERHALDLCVSAAEEVFGALFDRGDLVGVAAFDTVPCWLGPSAGDVHRERARRIFASHLAISSTPPSLLNLEGHYVDPMTHVRRQLSPESQVMLFSPLCDDYTAEVARRLHSAGHRVTIVSPDPTADRTVGQRLARIERTMRVLTLRERDIRVINWKYGSMLGLELERAKQRWAV